MDPSAGIAHFVFVDFENVPDVDLGGVEGKPVHVTLLIGKNQGKIDFALVDQIHRLSAQVELVKVGASGRNALDLTLACYLGQEVQQNPGAEFYIVSKDRDFEPMIDHLRGKNIKVTRHDSFATLPFLPKPKKHSPVKVAAPVKTSAPGKAVASVQATSGDERFEKLVTRLKNNSAPRPKKKSSLLAHINTVFGGKLNEMEQNQKLAELVRRGVLSIDAKDKVTYAAVPLR